MTNNFTDELKQKLLPYQIPHTENLIKILDKHNRVLDSSDTGTGKTYSAIATCVALKLKPLIICPKSVLSSWKNVLEHFSASYYGISNYESIQNCKYYTKSSGKDKIRCPYVKRIYTDNDKEEEINYNDAKESQEVDNIPQTKKDERKCIYKWTIPDDMVIIFDEAHRCKNLKTITSVLLYTLSNTKTVSLMDEQPCKIIMLSATIADKPKNFAICGYVLGIYSPINKAMTWIEKVGKNYDNPMSGVHAILYNEHASRMKIKELGDLFPKNSVKADCYDTDVADEIQKMYKLIEDAIENLKTKEDNTVGIGAIQYARMRIEQLKIPIYIELAKKYLKEGNAVAIFVNFTESLKTIAKELGSDCIIYGEQTMEERNKNIKDFNTDKSHIIICNNRSGGVGISLHDLNGNYPRVSIISPSWSAQDIIQVLGRIYRANGKTPVRQIIVYAKDTVEEGICNNMKDKIVNIALINDGNTDSYKIEGLTDDTIEDTKITEFDRIFLRVNALHTKKQRLLDDLKETENEIKDLEHIITNWF